MGRIFWQFFVAIWLTISAAIVFVVVANSYLNILPPKGAIREGQQRLGRETVSLLLSHGDVAMAQTYVATLAKLREPTLLTITPAAQFIGQANCKSTGPMAEMVFDAKNRHCYLVEIADPPLSLLETFTPAILPPLAVLLTSLFSAFFLARYLARPVIALRAGLSALAGGNFGSRIGSRPRWWKDELTVLGHDFDVTAAKLQTLQESQKRLFHDVSHELRSPLSRMQAAFGLVKKSPAKIDAILPRMEREIDRLDGLVEEILTLARLGSRDDSIIEWQTIDIIDLVNAIVEDAEFEAEDCAIRIDFDGVDTFIAEVNGEVIYRAVENVVRNAVKYSDRGTTILIRTEIAEGEGALVITVTNQGPYVPPSEIDRLFEPFTRFNESEMTVSGHGLGLAITRRAIETHGGRVWAQSNAQGGLTVCLVIPEGRH